MPSIADTASLTVHLPNYMVKFYYRYDPEFSGVIAAGTLAESARSRLNGRQLPQTHAPVLIFNDGLVRFSGQ